MYTKKEEQKEKGTFARYSVCQFFSLTLYLSISWLLPTRSAVRKKNPSRRLIVLRYHRCRFFKHIRCTFLFADTLAHLSITTATNPSPYCALETPVSSQAGSKMHVMTQWWKTTLFAVDVGDNRWGGKDLYAEFYAGNGYQTPRGELERPSLIYEWADFHVTGKLCRIMFHRMPTRRQPLHHCFVVFLLLRFFPYHLAHPIPLYSQVISNVLRQLCISRYISVVDFQ